MQLINFLKKAERKTYAVISENSKEILTGLIIKTK